jgi:hypothetical protein
MMDLKTLSGSSSETDLTEEPYADVGDILQAFFRPFHSANDSPLEMAGWSQLRPRTAKELIVPSVLKTFTWDSFMEYARNTPEDVLVEALEYLPFNIIQKACCTRLFFRQHDLQGLLLKHAARRGIDSVFENVESRSILEKVFPRDVYIGKSKFIRSVCEDALLWTIWDHIRGALQAGSFEDVRILWSQVSMQQWINRHYMKLLHYAIQGQNVQNVQLVLMNVVVEYEHIHTALVSGHNEILHYLLGFLLRPPDIYPFLKDLTHTDDPALLQSLIEKWGIKMSSRLVRYMADLGLVRCLSFLLDNYNPTEKCWTRFKEGMCFRANTLLELLQYGITPRPRAFSMTADDIKSFMLWVCPDRHHIPDFEKWHYARSVWLNSAGDEEFERFRSVVESLWYFISYTSIQ